MLWIVLIIVVVVVCYFIFRPSASEPVSSPTTIRRALPNDIYDAVEEVARVCSMCQMRSNAPAHLSIILRACGTQTRMECKCTGDGLAIFLPFVNACKEIEEWNGNSSILSCEANFDVEYGAVMLSGIRTSIQDGTSGKSAIQLPDPGAIVLQCEL